MDVLFCLWCHYMLEIANFSLEEDEEYSQLFITQMPKVSECDDSQNMKQDADFELQLLGISGEENIGVRDGVCGMEVDDQANYEDISDDGFVEKMNLDELKIE